MNSIKLLNIEDNEEYLRLKTSEINLDDINLLSIINILKKYCYENNIRSISANQLGISKQVIYFDKVIINPTVKEQKGLSSSVEECISLNNYAPYVLRPYRIKIQYYNELKKKITECIEGKDVTTMLRQIDYLNGVFATDRADIIFNTSSKQKDFINSWFKYNVIYNDGDYIDLKKKLVKTLKTV